MNLRLVRRGTPLTIQIPFSMFSRPDIELSVTVTLTRSQENISLGGNSGLSAERWVKFRYPLGLSVRFSSLSRHALFSGAGHAMNLSSEGVLVVPREDSAPAPRRWPNRSLGTIKLRRHIQTA